MLKGLRRLLRGLLPLVMLGIGAGPAAAAITLAGSASTAGSSPASSITINRPGSASAGRLLVALIVVRGDDWVWTAPSGWTLETLIGDGSTGSMSIYRRVSGASEPASYTFGLTGSSRVAGTIVAFDGVDGSTPIEASRIGVYAATSSPVAPSVTTASANAVVLAAFAQANGGFSMTPPSGMAEVSDVGTGAGPNGATLATAWVTQAVAGASGSKTASSSGSAVGAGVLLALRAGASTPAAPAGFNAFDPGTAAGSISGVLTTRIAGAASSVDVVALNAAGTGLHAGFSGTVSLSWLDARDDSGALAGSCRSSWTLVGAAGAAGSAVFSAASRVSVSVTPPAAGTRVMRLRLTASVGGSTVTACSGDAFAVIPASLTIAASDADAASAGTTRTLHNSAASGGVVHRAGRPFTITSQARSASGALMTAYDGTPQISITGCLLPAGCSAAALAYTALAASGGNYSNASVSYADVGAVSLQLADTGYAAVDAADTALAARTISSPVQAVGRFVPDGYTMSVGSAGQLATANGACLAAGSGATFVNQGFGWAAAPLVTVTAVNAAGATATRWSGTLMKLTAAMATPSMAASGAGSATVSSSFGAIAVTALGAGQARLAANALDRFVLALPAGSVTTSLSPDWSWTLALADSSEAGVAGNPTLSASVTQTPLPWSHGGVFHSGRLVLSPAHGDARAGVRMALQLQRWSSAGWVTMTEDRGCVSVARDNLGVESASGVFAASLCSAPLAATVTTSGGRAWLALPGTPGAAHGRVLLRVAGAASSGSACAALNTTQPLVPLALPWLLGGSAGTGSAALATWGRPHRDVVWRRETW